MLQIMPVICSSSVIESALLLLFTGLLVFHFGNYTEIDLFG
jgi:hypothetical protein